MTPVDGKGALELLTSFPTKLIPTISHPPVSLHEDCGTQVFILVPPVGGAGGGATGTENALVQTVQLGAVLNGLPDLLVGVLGLLLALEVGFDALVLLVKVIHVWDQVLDHVHMGKGVDLDLLAGFILGDFGNASQGVPTINIHSARPADTFTA